MKHTLGTSVLRSDRAACPSLSQPFLSVSPTFCHLSAMLPTGKEVS